MIFTKIKIRKISKLLISVFSFLFIFSFAVNVLAALIPGGGAGPTSETCRPDQLDTVFGCLDKDSGNNIGAKNVLPDFIVKFFNWTIGAIATFAMVGLIYAGYTYVTSAGNPDKIKLAKDIIITSLTGIILVIFSFALFNFFGLT